MANMILIRRPQIYRTEKNQVLVWVQVEVQMPTELFGFDIPLLSRTKK